MRVPLKWLREYVACELDAAELAERLTMAGIAVEEVEDLAAPVAEIVVGRVHALRRHPGADRLLLAETDWGMGVRTLVTAARNLKPGDLVPVAPVGASLPDGRRIAAAVFAGVASEGMLCSAAELGLERQSDGILVLTGDWPLGSPVAPAIGLDDRVLVLELTPNRADCLGILGVAREVAAVTGGRLRPPAVAPRRDGPEECASLARVEVAAPDLCPRYAGKVLLDVRVEPSPAWMQHRLRAAGIRPINNLVDITNYVMLEMNQPLHAFDLDRLHGERLIVRRAAAGEILRTLDETDRVLDEGMLVIADPKGPVAVAGVMGGAGSEIHDGTRRVFLEGACFDRTSVRRTARALGMRTEASLRFERGVDGAAVVSVLERAAALAEEIGAGRVARGAIDLSAHGWPPRTIAVRPERINGLLGTNLPAAEIDGYLERLGFGVAKGDGGASKVTVPTYRLDVETPADLAEEVARLYGYDRIPSTYPVSAQVGRRTPAQSLALRARRLLRGLGQTEVVTYSFTSPRLFDRLGWPEGDPRRQALRILAPLSEEWSIMRPTLLGGILEVLSYNARRGIHDAQIFELARVYRPVPGEELPDEELHLAGGLMGQAAPRHWAEKPRPLDFYDVKGLLEAFLDGLGIGPHFERGGDPSLHPGRSAVLRSAEGAILGQFGEAHPRVAEAYDLRGPVFLYELNFAVLASLACRTPRVEPPPRYPSIHRDLAVVVPEEVTLPALTDELRRLGGDLLRQTELFDVYTGPQVGAGRRSLAFALTFRADDRTLTDEEVGEVMDRLIRGLESRFGAVLR